MERVDVAYMFKAKIVDGEIAIQDKDEKVGISEVKWVDLETAHFLSYCSLSVSS